MESSTSKRKSDDSHGGRLNRLIKLLQSSSSSLVREQAISQLIAIVKAADEQLPSDIKNGPSMITYTIINKLIQLMISGGRDTSRTKSFGDHKTDSKANNDEDSIKSTWETRVACSDAIFKIMEYHGELESAIYSKDTKFEKAPILLVVQDKLPNFKFQPFEIIRKSLLNHDDLLATIDDSISLDHSSGPSNRDELLKQKRLLEKSMGLDMLTGDSDTSSLIQENDLVGTDQKHPELSSRQKASLKRQMKLAKRRKNEINLTGESTNTETGSSIKTKTPHDNMPQFIHPLKSSSDFRHMMSNLLDIEPSKISLLIPEASDDQLCVVDQNFDYPREFNTFQIFYLQILNFILSPITFNNSDKLSELSEDSTLVSIRSPYWEIRHGCCMILRDLLHFRWKDFLLRYQSVYSGPPKITVLHSNEIPTGYASGNLEQKDVKISSNQMQNILDEVKNLEFLQKPSNSLVYSMIPNMLYHVFVLDKFTDYVGDSGTGVFAPVRESLGQCVGVLCSTWIKNYAQTEQNSDDDLICSLVRGAFLLESFDISLVIHDETDLSIDKSELSRTQKSLQTGSAIQLKYIMGAINSALDKTEAAEQKYITSIMCIEGFIPKLINSICHFDDDIRQMLVSSFVPMLPFLTKNLSSGTSILSPEQFKCIMNNAWIALDDIDDLCGSTASVMELILWIMEKSDTLFGSVNSKISVRDLFSGMKLVVKFLRHNMASVRRQAVSVFGILGHLLFKQELNTEAPITDLQWLRIFMGMHMLNFLVEYDPSVLKRTSENWNVFLNYMSTDSGPGFPKVLQFMKTMICQEGWMNWWMYIIVTPPGQTLPWEYLPDLSNPDSMDHPMLMSRNLRSIPAFKSHLDTSLRTLDSIRRRKQNFLGSSGSWNPIDIATITQDWEVISEEQVLSSRVNCIKAIVQLFARLTCAAINFGSDSEPLLAIFQNIISGLLGSNGEVCSVYWNIIIGQIAKYFAETSKNIHLESRNDNRTDFTTLSQLINSSPELDAAFILPPTNDILVWYSKIMRVLGSRMTKIVYFETKVPAIDVKSLYDMYFILNNLYDETNSVLNFIISHGKIPKEVISTPIPTVGHGFSVEISQTVADSWCPKLMENHVAKAFAQVLSRVSKKDLAAEKKRQEEFYSDAKARIISLKSFISRYFALEDKFRRRSLSMLSAGLVTLGYLGVDGRKLSPIIKSLMEGLRSEENRSFQNDFSYFVVLLLQKLVSSDNEAERRAAMKICSNACGYIVADISKVPLLKDKFFQENEDVSFRFSPSFNEYEKKSHEDVKLARRGGEFFAANIAKMFGDELLDSFPVFLDLITTQLLQLSHYENVDSLDQETFQRIANAVELCSIFSEHVAVGLLKRVIFDKAGGIIYPILRLLTSKNPGMRFVASNCIGKLVSLVYTRQIFDFSPMETIIENILPMMGDTASDVDRVGISELVYELIERLDGRIVPYLVFFIVPILGRMSDQNDSVRALVTRCFSRLMELMPLEGDSEIPADLSTKLIERRNHERNFIVQLLDPSKLQPYKIPIKIKAELRSYQIDGINWLGFLNSYQLHGILCDDMGLGKTLQTITIMASDQFYRSKIFRESQSPDHRPLPNLVICPNSVTGHWKHEILNYTENFVPLVYSGSPSERKELQPECSGCDFLIVSYEVLRNDIEFFQKLHFNYHVLDEGHIIKNSASKITQAVKSIRSNHRLILSGTPIQNNVLELWSLFDFLMPGFLGDEKQFTDRYAKPIIAMKNIGGFNPALSRNQRQSSRMDPKRIQEAGTLALESLHKQVLPFLMRRLKEDVLKDLPPKIIQDYYCELSPLQKKLYEEFVQSQAGILHDEKSSKSTHIFKALQFMRKLCNHPSLVVSENSKNYSEEILPYTIGQSLSDVRNAPKLLALKELLDECGIGSETPSHRVLIFCQMKSMINLIENQLFGKFFPTMSYMRLDGSTPANSRQDIVFKFNQDPSIELLLLTTNVGGLGLNLTGADTVIFVEHDWNPMKDLQAMDRAHRLGQKKVVNVYRLITRNTLEEKIMGLQRFKLNIANTIINEENSGAGLKSMDSSEILDLFQPTGAATEKRKRKSEISNLDEPQHKKMRNFTGIPGISSDILEELGSMAEKSADQYDEEFDMKKFAEKYS